MKKLNIIKTGLLLLAVALAVACTKEDLTICGVDVSFRYDHNMEGTDQFADSVTKVNLYVFNEAGRFVGHYEEKGPFSDDFKMRIDLPAGTYHFVVWGDLGEEYTVTPLTVPALSRANTLSDATLSLTSGTNGRVDTHPTGLYHGMRSNEEIVRPFGVEVEIPLIKNTKKVTAVFDGLPVSEGTVGNLVCRIEAMNGNYTFSHHLTGENRRLNYMPKLRTDFSGETSVVSFDFVTMRLFANNDCRSRLILEYYPENGAPMTELFNVSLTDAIKEMYGDDVDFDRRSNYELLFFASRGDIPNYTFTDVTIKIGDWVVTQSPGGIIW
jgi:hypothetical protein